MLPKKTFSLDLSGLAEAFGDVSFLAEAETALLLKTNLEFSSLVDT